MRNSAVLLIDCPDRRSLVARVSSLLYEQGAHILPALSRAVRGIWSGAFSATGTRLRSAVEGRDR